ncbi:hypothetical protein [Sagittula sp. MA-2]|jgi:hypothetical protein|uniref:hypothetical protein n=1 Tax=Sagittula sp. MA-2 TaxID=3048007 RepID=UPI0024C2F2D8|nr:hypothetical protein [Sagittula sp. MA-2]WHZ34880.1 hypothetical protein QNI11_19885 [Sagittula sp. MA-2]
MTMVGYRVFDKLKLVRFAWVGRVDPEELAQVSIEYALGPDFDPEYRMSMDLSGGWLTSVKEVQLLIDLCRPYYRAHSAPTRSALFAPDDRSFRIATAYATLAAPGAGYPITIFRDAAGALGHLGIDPANWRAQEVFDPAARAQRPAQEGRGNGRRLRKNPARVQPAPAFHR